MGKLSKKEFNDFKVNNVIRLSLYLVYILVGLVIYAKSYLKYSAIINFLGILFIVTGCLYVYMNGKEKKISLTNFDLLFGILVAVDGLLMILNPGKIINNLVFYFGLFFVICGLQKLVVAIKLFKSKSDAASVTLVSSLLIMLLGILLVLNIFKTTSLTELTGIFILFFGVIQLANTILLNTKEKEIAKKN